MDPIHVAPPSSTHGKHGARQKPASENAPAPGAFFALLSGLGEQAVGDEQTVLPTDVLADDSDPADTPRHLFAGGAPGALPIMSVGNALGDASALTSLQGIASDVISAMVASGAGPQGTGVGSGVAGTTGTQGASRIGQTLSPRADGRGQKASGWAADGQSSVAMGWDGMIAPEGRLVAGSLASASLVAQTARMDAATTAPTVGAANLRGAASSSMRRSTGLLPSTTAQSLAQAPDVTGKHASLGQVPGVDVLSASKEAQTALANHSLPAEANKQAEVGRSSVNDALGFAGLPPLSMAGGTAAGDLNRERSQQGTNERTGFGSTAVGGTWGESAASPALDAGAGNQEGGVPSPEDAIAEQVTYWLSENLKNAELTVEHAGQPVEVRVSLAGNEAHVAFRSDQAETRELLGAKLEQLRELLQGQGLELSGATVDTGSSGQPRGFEEKKAPEGARTLGVQRGPDVPVGAIRRILTSSSVDLYV